MQQYGRERPSTPFPLPEDPQYYSSNNNSQQYHHRDSAHAPRMAPPPVAPHYPAPQYHDYDRYHRGSVPDAPSQYDEPQQPHHQHHQQRYARPPSYRSRGGYGNMQRHMNQRRDPSLVTSQRFNVWVERIEAALEKKQMNIKSPDGTDVVPRIAEKVVAAAVAYNKHVIRHFSAPFAFETTMRIVSDYISHDECRVNADIAYAPHLLLIDALTWSVHEFKVQFEKQKQQSNVPNQQDAARVPSNDESAPFADEYDTCA